jgi:two-component system OmpR family sensor kinase
MTSVTAEHHDRADDTATARRRTLRGRLSTRQRLTLQVSAALLLLWLAIGWFTVGAVEDQIYASIDDELAAEIPTVAGALELLTDDELRALTSQPGSAPATALIVVGPDGTDLLIPSGSAARPDPAPDLGSDTVSSLRGRAGVPYTVPAVDGDSRYRVLTSPLDDGRVVVRAQLLDDAEDVIEDLRAVIILACLATVLGAALLVWLISRQALKPLEDVIATADEVGDAGDQSLSERVAVTSTAPDVVRLADALNVMLDRIEESFDRRRRTEDRLRQFVSDASHELRTPLAAVIGFGELYQQFAEREGPERPSTPSRDEIVGRMLTEAGRMSELVDELLLLARTDEHQLTQTAEVDLAALVADSVASVQTTTATHEFVLSAEPVRASCDPRAIRSVVDNLLVNVVAHTPDGTTTEITVRADGSDAVLTVADDGPGLTPAQAARAFDRFWRGAPDRGRPGGSGLGLAIVDAVARAHGGTARIEDAPQGGLSVTVRIPIAPVGTASRFQVPEPTQ